MTFTLHSDEVNLMSYQGVMFHRKARRNSVMIDLNGRVRSLLDLTQSLNEGESELGGYVDKITLLDYLHLSRLVMGKLCKIQSIKLEFEKILFDANIQSADSTEVDDIFDLDKSISLTQDSYTRCVGNFSQYISLDELWMRVKKLDGEVINSTNNLATCVHNYIQVFYDTRQNPEQRSSGAPNGNSYIDALTDINPDIVLLPMIDRDKVIKLVSTLPSSEIQRISVVMQSLMPKIRTESVEAKKTSVWRHVNTRLGNVKKENPLVSLTTQLDAYFDICEELHLDKHERYVSAHLPPNTTLLRVLDKQTIKKFPDMSSYVDENDKHLILRRGYDTIASVLTTIIDAIAVLAAFRTTLLSKELQSLRLDATSTLLDVPEKADLEAFLSQIQPLTG